MGNIVKPIIQIAALCAVGLLTVGCVNSLMEVGCEGDSDLDFVASGDGICYKPSYTPSLEALEEAKAAVPDRVFAWAEQRTYRRLVNRRCPRACAQPDLRQCPMVTNLSSIDFEKGEFEGIETKERPDPECVKANNAVLDLADMRCSECTGLVSADCLDESGRVLGNCILPSDELSEARIEMEIEERRRALDSLYTRLLAD